MRLLLYLLSLFTGLSLAFAYAAPHWRARTLMSGEPTTVLYAEGNSTDNKLEAQGLRYVGYDDADFGFSLAVPQGWSRVQLDDPAEGQGTVSGYAVGFESAWEGQDDAFRDHLLVELLPASRSAAFTPEPSTVRWRKIAGETARIGRIRMPDMPSRQGQVDLVIWQAEIVRSSYTVGLYAIGEQHAMPVLEKAFEAMLQTFRLPGDPFSVV